MPTTQSAPRSTPPSPPAAATSQPLPSNQAQEGRAPGPVGPRARPGVRRLAGSVLPSVRSGSSSRRERSTREARNTRGAVTTNLLPDGRAGISPLGWSAALLPSRRLSGRGCRSRRYRWTGGTTAPFAWVTDLAVRLPTGSSWSPCRRSTPAAGRKRASTASTVVSRPPCTTRRRAAAWPPSPTVSMRLGSPPPERPLSGTPRSRLLPRVPRCGSTADVAVGNLLVDDGGVAWPRSSTSAPVASATLHAIWSWPGRSCPARAGKSSGTLAAGPTVGHGEGLLREERGRPPVRERKGALSGRSRRGSTRTPSRRLPGARSGYR